MRLTRHMSASVAALAIVLAACQSAASPPRTISLQTLNDSGVTGSVTFTDMGAQTGVAVTVEPAGNLDMPAHIHPGTCANLTPQPKYPLENVRNGASSTVVQASMAELFAGNLAVNLHKSNDDLETYTACVDIATAGSSPTAGSSASPPAAIAVTIQTATGETLAFDPAEVTVATTGPLEVTFQNRSELPHNLVFTEGVTATTKTIVEPGASDTLRLSPPAAGRYPFVCTIHDGMAGTLVVQGSQGVDGY